MKTETVSLGGGLLRSDRGLRWLLGTEVITPFLCCGSKALLVFAFTAWWCRSSCGCRRVGGVMLFNKFEGVKNETTHSSKKHKHKKQKNARSNYSHMIFIQREIFYKRA